jgi:hypothetical protein
VKQVPDVESLDIAASYPDIRVADTPPIIALFEGKQRDKLIPLLEAEKITAWGRPMGGRGEPPPIRLDGKLWRTHHLLFLPKTVGQFDINQTYLKTNTRQETTYYDVHLNKSQIIKVWPELFSKAVDSPSQNEVPLWEAARRTYDECKHTRGGKIAQGLNNSQDEIISYYAYALAEKIPIYGTPPLSSKKEKVALKLGSSALRIEFRNGVAYAVSAFSDGLENSNSLFVYEDELEQAIAKIKNII